ncbi:MAG TPA: hypothetical protein VF282_05055 [Bacillota bacterium]
MRLQSPSVSWTVVGIGAVVTLLGWFMRPSPLAYGITGFGLAHVVLGLLDLYRTGPGQGGGR